MWNRTPNARYTNRTLAGTALLKNTREQGEGSDRVWFSIRSKLGCAGGGVRAP